MSVDFIHCNNCLRLPSNGIRYYLTKCGKIYCKECEQLFINNCDKCLPNNCQNIELNENIKPEIKLCFRDMSYSFKKLQNVETFQKSQRINLINKLFEENKRLRNEFNSQKELLIKFENENKSLKTIIEKRNNETIAENQSIYGLNRNKKKEKKPLFSDLFAAENEMQLNRNNSEIQSNNNTINRNVINNQTMASNHCSNESSIPKPLSPLQSLRGSRITLRPNYSRDYSGFTGRQSETVEQQINGQSNRFNTTPMTVSSNSSLGSLRPTITPFNRVAPQRTPSTGYSSIPNSLSSLKFGDRNLITRKVYPFNTHH